MVDICGLYFNLRISTINKFNNIRGVISYMNTCQYLLRYVSIAGRNIVDKQESDTIGSIKLVNSGFITCLGPSYPVQPNHQSCISRNRLGNW